MKKNYFLIFLAAFWLLEACSTAHNIDQIARRQLIDQADLRSAHLGISIYDAETSSFIYNYQGDKFFTPASNTKLFSLYAGMKYLGDSLVGIRYRQTDTALFVLSTGDPTLLHPAYPDQPVVHLLQHATGSIYLA